MSKQDNPRYTDGEVRGCDQGPISCGPGHEYCLRWWNRHGLTKDQTCPTPETYAEACQKAVEWGIPEKLADLHRRPS